MKIKLFLDSGAYAAWSRKVDLPLKEYIRYLKRNGDAMFAYVNMDTIPGVFGKLRQPGDFDKSATQSYETLQRMLDAGLRPIPVIHQGEQLSWLERHIEEGHDYIGVSATKDPFADHQTWLDQAFSLICDKKGRPRVKVHGFGITTPKLLMTYPFYSVDSTSWLLSPAYGHLIMPRVNLKGEFDFSKLPVRYVTSGVDHDTPSHNKMDFRTVGPLQDEVLTRYIQDNLKCSPEELQHSTDARRRSVIVYMQQLVKHSYPVRFNHHIPNLVRDKGNGKDAKLNVMYVLSWQPAMSRILASCNANTQLISYAEIKDRKEEDVQHYIETGELRTRLVKKRRGSWNDNYYLSIRALGLHRRFDANNDQSV